jgi:oligopeptide transport system substrate-binding protein
MQLDYDIARAGWIGDYEDPNTFLNMWVTNGGNNQTGWGNPAYDRLIAAAADSERVVQDPSDLLPLLKDRARVEAILNQVRAATVAEARLEALNRLRMALFREAESMLVNDELPIIPIYFYVNNGLVRSRVKGFYREIETADGRKRPNLRGVHPLSAIYVDDSGASGNGR